MESAPPHVDPKEKSLIWSLLGRAEFVMKGPDFRNQWNENLDKDPRGTNLMQLVCFEVHGRRYRYTPPLPLQNKIALIHSLLQYELNTMYKGMNVTSFNFEMTQEDVVLLIDRTRRRLYPSRHTTHKPLATVIGEKKETRKNADRKVDTQKDSVSGEVPPDSGAGSAGSDSGEGGLRDELREEEAQRRFLGTLRSNSSPTEAELEEERERLSGAPDPPTKRWGKKRRR